MQTTSCVQRMQHMNIDMMRTTTCTSRSNNNDRNNNTPSDKKSRPGLLQWLRCSRNIRKGEETQEQRQRLRDYSNNSSSSKIVVSTVSNEDEEAEEDCTTTVNVTTVEFVQNAIHMVKQEIQVTTFQMKNMFQYATDRMILHHCNNTTTQNDESNNRSTAIHALKRVKYLEASLAVYDELQMELEHLLFAIMDHHQQHRNENNIFLRKKIVHYEEDIMDKVRSLFFIKEYKLSTLETQVYSTFNDEELIQEWNYKNYMDDTELIKEWNRKVIQRHSVVTNKVNI